MKKNWISYVFAFTVFISISTFSVIAVESQDNGISVEPSSIPEKKERKPIVWRPFKSENELALSFEAPNQISLVKSAVARNQTIFIGEKGKYNFQIETNAVIPVSKMSDKFYGSLGYSVGRHIHSINTAVYTKYYRSQYASFAIVGGEASKVYEFNHGETELKPFTNLGWYIPTETHYVDNNAGFVWRSGMDFSTKKFGKTELSLISQFLEDSGAIQAGNRMAINTEATCILPSFYGMRIGPRFGYTHFFFPLTENNRLIKQNKFSFGLVFKII